MTRQELIEQAAIEYCSGNKGADARVRGAFLIGAEWADEHPDLYTVTRKAIAREREYLIKKATEWLTAHVTEEKYHPERGFWNIGRFLDDFKKYMEDKQ